MSDQVQLTNKPFDLLSNLFNANRIKEKHPNLSQTQTNNLSLSTLNQMLGHASFSQSQLALEEIGKTVYSFLSHIRNQSEPLKVIDTFLDENKKDRGRGLLKTSYNTYTDVFDTIRPEIVDNALSNQNSMISTNLKKKALLDTESSLALDPTVKKYTGIKANQCQPTGYIGQRETYGKAFNENTIYDSTNQFVLKSQPKYATGSHYKRKETPDWITAIQSKIGELDNQGVHIRAIYGDREFYQGIGFAYAYLGWFNLKKDLNHNPRLCVPKKLHNGIEKKWEFLLDPLRNEIEVDSIEINYYHNGLIRSSLSYFISNSTQTRYQIPFYSVSTYDAYSNRKKKQSLSWARNMARKIQNDLKETRISLKQAEDVYLKSRLSHFPDKKAEIPKYKGKLRKKFKFMDEKSIYLECRKWYDKLTRLESKKKKICKRLMFFCVSCRHNETIDIVKVEVVKVAEGYHQRWGVESAFQCIKGKFWIPCKKRSVQARHVRFIISSMIYNAWHYYRLLKLARKSHFTAQQIRSAKIWHKNVNKKILNKMNHTLTAGEFITQSWGTGLIKCLKSKIG